MQIELTVKTNDYVFASVGHELHRLHSCFLFLILIELCILWDTYTTTMMLHSNKDLLHFRFNIIKRVPDNLKFIYDLMGLLHA